MNKVNNTIVFYGLTLIFKDYLTINPYHKFVNEKIEEYQKNLPIHSFLIRQAHNAPTTTEGLKMEEQIYICGLIAYAFLDVKAGIPTKLKEFYSFIRDELLKEYSITYLLQIIDKQFKLCEK